MSCVWGFGVQMPLVKLWDSLEDLTPSRFSHSHPLLQTFFKRKPRKHDAKAHPTARNDSTIFLSIPPFNHALITLSCHSTSRHFLFLDL